MKLEQFKSRKAPVKKTASFLADSYALFSLEKGAFLMKINYKDANGQVIELEVSDEVGTFYLESVKREKSNDRRNSRPDRHTLLSTFEYEDVRFFDDGTDLLGDVIQSETISNAMACLSERQQYLVQKCIIEGWSYKDLAKFEGKDESAIRHAVNRAKKKLRDILS